jgi:hypothetical protein
MAISDEKEATAQRSASEIKLMNGISWQSSSTLFRLAINTTDLIRSRQVGSTDHCAQ